MTNYKTCKDCGCAIDTDADDYALWLDKYQCDKCYGSNPKNAQAKAALQGFDEAVGYVFRKLGDNEFRRRFPDVLKERERYERSLM